MTENNEVMLQEKRGRGRPKKEEDISISGLASAPAPAPETAKKRGRPKKKEDAETSTPSGEPGMARKRGRPKKTEDLETSASVPEMAELKKKEDGEASTPVSGSARKRGRPKKEVDANASAPAPESSRKRGRPKKKEDAETSVSVSASVSSQDRAKRRGRPKKEAGAKSSVRVRDIAKKRGRPRKVDNANTSAEVAKKRGRPKKKDAKTSPKASKTGKKRGRPKKTEGAKTSGSEISRKRGRPKKDDSKNSAPASKKAKTTTEKTTKKRYLSKIIVDGVEFQVGDDVYVKKSDGNGEESDIEVEDCRICGTLNEQTMLECDSCLAGYHLSCLIPPLENIPEGDWICPYCEKGESPPEPSNSQPRHRSARERLLARELWAARIERMWRDPEGKSWFSAHWFLVPEETSVGRQPHNGKRELFRSNRTDDNEMDSILRHCYVMTPTDYKNSAGEGDDVFFCEYEYNEQWCKFKRIEYLDDNENWSEDDQPFDPSSDDSDEEGTADKSNGRKRRRSSQGKKLRPSNSIKAANKRRNYSRGIEEVGAKAIPDGVRKRPQTDFDRAKAALALSAVPPSLPCRDRERKEISAFLGDSVGAGEHCLGRCLYISGVPGTGKTATVLEVITELGRKVESGELPPYRFVEINGLRLPSPEHAYTILHEALTGQHVGWKRALQYLDERFSRAEPAKGVDARPTVLLVDELDLLVTRNQSVLYNIFDWPTRPQSRLVIIGIANTMDLPERMLPRIASRMGMHRISFSPYSHTQLEEIISTRLKGVPVFDKQAAEFASRKVAAVSGDIRRALELCRRAVEVAEDRLKLLSSSAPASSSNNSSNGATATEGHQVLQGKSGSIILADVDAAISEMFEAPQIQMMKRSAKLAKIFLVAMVYEQRRTSMSETTFEKIATTCSEMCMSNGDERPDWDTLLAIGCKLGGCRLLLCEPGAQHRLQKLQLNFPCDDVSFALNKDEETPWLAKYL